MPKQVDFRGLSCPEPVVRSKHLLETTKPQALEILVDNQASLENVTRFWQKAGYTVSSQAEGSFWRILASQDGAVAQEEEAPSENLAKTVVLLTTETLGRGDDELGAKLMANFLGTLPEFGAALWRIILLNGGVKLAATPGPALDNLQKLAAQGVTIMVCGTCLNHYNLLEKKQVGETTNMLDIVSALSLADKVIRP